MEFLISYRRANRKSYRELMKAGEGDFDCIHEKTDVVSRRPVRTSHYVLDKHDTLHRNQYTVVSVNCWDGSSLNIINLMIISYNYHHYWINVKIQLIISSLSSRIEPYARSTNYDSYDQLLTTQKTSENDLVSTLNNFCDIFYTLNY